MAQYTTILCPAGEWTQLTDADADEVAFQGQSGFNTTLLIKCTADGTEPTTTEGADLYRGNEKQAQIPIEELGFGLSAPLRVWVFPSEDVLIKFAQTDAA